MSLSLECVALMVLDQVEEAEPVTDARALMSALTDWMTRSAGMYEGHRVTEIVCEALVLWEAAQDTCEYPRHWLPERAAAWGSQ